LTTPESLEGMLVSTKVDHRRLFGGLRAVVVDELHAFAGDDRGWHLLSDLVAGPGGRQILLTDPAGNLIELFQPAHRPSAPTPATP
jgi:ATP-dependent helicase Lhr and Lhr-like helicase